MVDTTIPVIVGSILGVIVLATAVIVVTVIIVCLKYRKFKKNSCYQDRKLQLEEKKEDNIDADRKECRKQEETKERHREYHRQWSREQVEKLLKDIREMRECAKRNIEMFREYMKVANEISDKLISSIAPDSGDVVTDSEEERNKEMEREQKEQLLKLLRHILRGGRRNESLKAEMLVAIKEEVGSDKKCQCTCL